MSERNDRKILPNCTYNERMSAPYTATPSPPFISNSVPFHSICFQTPYYPAQPVTMGLRIHYARPNRNHGETGHVRYNNNYPDIPAYERGVYRSLQPASYTNADFSSDSSPHFKVPTPQHNKEHSYNAISSQESNSSSIKPRELQASAKEFVPQEGRKENTSNEISGKIVSPSSNSTTDVSNSHSIIKKSENNFVNDKYTKSNNNNNSDESSTRPKEFTKGRSQGNKKYWPTGSNWQRPNIDNRTFSTHDIRSSSGEFSSNTSKQNFVPNDLNSRNQRTQRRFQNGAQFHNQRYGYHNNSQNFYKDSNGYYNNSQNSSNQRRENPVSKKMEWRRSNDSSYDYRYYKDENRDDYSDNWNRNASRRYPARQDRKPDFREKDKNMQFATNWNQKTRRKPAPQYSRNNVGSERKNNMNILNKGTISEEKHERKSVENEEEDITLKGFQLLPNQDGKTQRENLTENLSKGLYECMVCCEVIRQQHAIWSCNKCYNCFHLGCIKKWAETSQVGEPGWRCPACQNLNSKIPNGYFCFCKKLREPEWNRRETPHSCGEVCGRRRENEWCTHKCTILCHPGPCPDCNAFIKRACQCGKNTKDMKCSQADAYLCENECRHSLNCGVHFCQKLCHVGDCEPCMVVKEEECYCAKEKRTVECNSETANRESYSCNGICNKTLSCGHHSCKEVCHEGSCKPCDRAVETVTTCPCGKMNLATYYESGSTARESCLDPIPTCAKVCHRTLTCGTPGNYHTCQTECHEGPCPPCKDKTAVKCRCGFMDRKILCSELLSKADEVTCEKQCKKLRQCGRHKCGLKCCIDIDHLCSRICGRTLNCRLHKCEEPCHRGNCPRCWETSFDELSCQCGAAVLYPPIPCGTEPPACQLPCRRQQSCSHLVLHTCHADPKCPPCTTLVSKLCFGGHMTMKSTPCYVKAMSCGEQCAEKLSCGFHLCQKVCHDGSCIQGSSCTQNCSEIRRSCEHPCNSPCHLGQCPNTPCKEMVTVTCICGNRKVKMVCAENEREYKSMATSKLASELHTLNSGGSVDISQIFSGSNKAEKMKRLECNEECGLIARNRQLALALQITNPDARETLGDGRTLLFADTLKEEARKDLQFAQMIHNTLNDLVMKAKQSKQKSRSHSFAPMNRDKRRFIHEYSKYFGCQSESYDEEPKKNVVVTAVRTLSRLPPTSVVSVIQKEQGQRKVPGPVLTRKGLANEDTQERQMKRLEKGGSFEKQKENKEGNITGSASSVHKESSPSSSKQPQSPIIDYFDLS